MDWAKGWSPGFGRTLMGVGVGVRLHRASGLGRASGGWPRQRFLWLGVKGKNGVRPLPVLAALKLPLYPPPTYGPRLPSPRSHVTP